MDHLDVAVIGAGAAGIAAGRTLAEKGLSFTLLEANARIGGRGYTIVREDMPLDMGCGWLHSADRNPWVGIATQLGIEIDRTPPPWGKQSFQIGMSREEQQSFDDAMTAFDRRVEEMDTAHDAAASCFLAPACRWNPLLDAVSTYFNGVELTGMSALDYRNFDDTEINWRIPTGIGALMAAHAAGLPVMADTPVREIDHRGHALRIVTDRGVLSARAAIITVPTGVIAGEGLRFTPALPEKAEAAARLPLGIVNKVFLACRDPQMFPKDGHFFGDIRRTGTGSYHLRPFGRPIIEVFIAGELARQLGREGAQAAEAFAVGELMDLLGSDIYKHLGSLAGSAWESERFIGGAYSHAEVGFAAGRAQLAAPVDDRLFFAGEACSEKSYSTVHGAFLTGRAAAEAAARALRKELDLPPGLPARETLTPPPDARR